MKVVINKCFGGFGLSAKAVMLYAKLCGFKVHAYVDERLTTPEYDGDNNRIIRLPDDAENGMVMYYVKNDLGDVTTSDKLNAADWFHEGDIKRDDVNLVKVVSELKKEANGHCADLKIINIPKGVNYEIEEYDGLEHIAEKHRTWG